MPEDFMGIKKIKHEIGTNEWVDVHMTCTELWPVGAERLQQVGQLSDGTEASIKFLSYETSDVQSLERGCSYVIRDAMTISDETEGRALLLKADTYIEDASAPSGAGSPNGPDCEECGDPLPMDAYHEDGLAPEIGWEYWQCPSCNNKMRPADVE